MNVIIIMIVVIAFFSIIGILIWALVDESVKAAQSLKKSIKLKTLEKKRAETKRKKEKANEREQARDYDNAIEIWEELGQIEEAARVRKEKANEREQARDYDTAIEVWEELGEIEEAARVRKMREDMGSVKVAQKVVQGDYIDDRDTIIKDSVVSKSNVSSGSSKMQELKDLTEMKEKGLIDDDEFKQMKKEILGK